MATKHKESISIDKWFSASGFAALTWYWQWLAFTLLAILMYWPVLGNTFLSDDHLVLWKVGVQQQLNVDGFFRPLSDITLWLTYRLAGMNAFPYYFSQVLLHALNAVMLLQYLRKMNLSSAVGLLAAIFFLSYPFHNEAVAWILGRGSLMAGSFAMASMLVLVGNWQYATKNSVIALCYFVGMVAYETLIILPLMVVAQMLIMREPGRRIFAMSGLLLVVFLLHSWIRITVSGSFLGDYGAGFFAGLGWETVQAMLKSAGRILLPPSDNSHSLMLAFIVAVVVLTIAYFITWKKSSAENRKDLYVLLACFAIAMMVPMWLGVSTRTSESDRFLYLPSFFFCSLLSFLALNLFREMKKTVILIGFLLLAQLALLELNNMNWRMASNSVRQLIGKIRGFDKPGKLLLVNLPGEIDGAYVFRMGFDEALRLYGIDSSKVTVVNKIDRSQQLLLPQGSNRIIKEEGAILILPGAILFTDGPAPENWRLQQAANTGRLKETVEEMLVSEQAWNFRAAAKAMRIKRWVASEKLSWNALGIGILGPQDDYLSWNFRYWIKNEGR